MRYFPMFLDFRGRVALVAGGGEQAAQKVRLIGRSEAEVVVMAPELGEELAGLAAQGRLRHAPCVYDEAEVDRAFAVFCASGCVGVDAWISARVQARGGLANVVDKPRLCSAITPALVDRDPLVAAIGTEGVAPVMAQRVKTLVESHLEPGLGDFLREMAALRPRIMETDFPGGPRAFWNWVMDAPRARAAGGDLAGAVAEVRAALEGGGPAAAPAARATLIALPEGGADLLALRAVRRMQEADLLIHAPDAPRAALDYARRDAERLAAEGFPADALRAALARGERATVLVPGRDWSAALEAAELAGLEVEALGAGRAL